MGSVEDSNLLRTRNAESALIRRLHEHDSFDALTDLLHRAYAPLAAMGFRYLATHQDVETTRKRSAKGECYLALIEDRIVGTLVLVPPDQSSRHCEWYDRLDVAVVNQFAIEPELQRAGLGSRLLAFAEARAAKLGAKEVSIDTAEGAAHLIAFYATRGYRHVGHAQWGHTNFRSVLLSKRVSASHAETLTSRG